MRKSFFLKLTLFAFFWMVSSVLPKDIFACGSAGDCSCGATCLKCSKYCVNRMYSKKLKIYYGGTCKITCQQTLVKNDSGFATYNTGGQGCTTWGNWSAYSKEGNNGKTCRTSKCIKGDTSLYRISCLDGVSSPSTDTSTCTMTASGSASVVAGTTNRFTSYLTTSGTVTSNKITATGFTPVTTDQAYKVVYADLVAPTTAGSYTITLNGTLSNGNTCTKSMAVTVTNPETTVLLRACNSEDMLTCAGCDEPEGFTGKFELHDSSKTYGTKTVSGNTSATFTEVPGASVQGTYVGTLSTTKDDWTIISPAKAFPPLTDPWTTDGKTYGPYDFCVTQHKDPWIQLVGGDGLAAKGSVAMLATEGSPFLGNLSGSPYSSGVIMSHVGTSINGTIGPEDREWAISNSSFFTPPKEGFYYFVRTFELGSSPVADSLAKTGMTVPTEAPASGKGAYYLTGDVSIDTPWHITNGQSYTFFVTGNLTVSSDIVVDKGGFLSFVVLGNTTITGTVSQLQGIYLSDGSISMVDGNGSGLATLDSSKQLAVEGSIIGWTGVSITRTLDNLDNNTYPAVRFTYRPDFLVNIPNGFKRNAIGWREVAP